MNALLLGQIAQAFSVLAMNPAFGKDGQAVGAVASLVGIAFQHGVLLDVEREKLLQQILQANAEGRSLTDEEMAVWAERHAVAKAQIEAWKPQR